MGYDVHITRKEEWYDDDGNEITLEEWTDFVNSSPDMRLDGFAEAEIKNGILRVESEGLSVWTDYSKHEQDRRMAWFGYSEGNIVVKHPDEEILRNMYQIAQVFGAKVQGDEGEIYDAEGASNWKERRAEFKAATKKWWQFWK